MLCRTSKKSDHQSHSHHRKMPPAESANAPSAPNAPSESSSSSATATKTVESKRLPPPETQESLWLRRSVILSFWLVVLALGLPIWWKTTAIYRAELPLQIMTEWADGKVSPIISIDWDKVDMNISRYASQSSPFALP